MHGPTPSCLRAAAAAGSLSWVLALSRNEECPSTLSRSEPSLSPHFQGNISGRNWRVTWHSLELSKLCELTQLWPAVAHQDHAPGRKLSSCHAVLISPETDVPPTALSLLAFQQLLFPQLLQPAPPSLSAWHASHSAAPDANFARGPSVAAAATRHYRSNTSTSLRVVDIAAEHPDVIATIQKKLEERGIALPPAHFANTDVELTRYAITVGLLAAHTTADRERVAEAAAARAQATAEWLQSHTFMPEEQLSKWTNVVHWAEDDSDGHPVLVVHLGAALEQDAAGAATAAEAILAHMESALQRRFNDAPGRPEQLVVVLDSRGASTLQFRRLVRTIQSIAVTLNRHYPARLHRLYLVDAPVIVHLPVRAIKALLHLSTSSKIIICDLGDPRLPLDLDFDSASGIHHTAEAPPPEGESVY
ncbi:g7100 [Coccomyxa elongata]